MSEELKGDIGAALSSTPAGSKTALVCATYAADFNAIEYCQRLRYYQPALTSVQRRYGFLIPLNFVKVVETSVETRDDRELERTRTVSGVLQTLSIDLSKSGTHIDTVVGGRRWLSWASLWPRRTRRTRLRERERERERNTRSSQVDKILLVLNAEPAAAEMLRVGGVSSVEF